MSWLSELKWSNRLEHLYAMIAGEEELDESVPSTYDRKQGFLYKIAQKVAQGGNPGYSVEETKTLLTEETVTTVDDNGDFVAPLSYDSQITADTIIVTFDGVEYTCDAIATKFGFAYGGFVNEQPDFTDYPFTIVSNPRDTVLVTETAGTHTVKIEVPSTTVETTDAFEMAVESVVGPGGGTFVVNVTAVDDGNGNYTATSDKTVDEILSAANAGKLCVAKVYETYGAKDEYSSRTLFVLPLTEYDATVDAQQANRERDVSRVFAVFSAVLSGAILAAVSFGRLGSVGYHRDYLALDNA